MDLTPQQQKNIEDLASFGKIADALADLSKRTGISIESLVDPNGMLVAIAKRRLTDEV